MIPSDKTYWDYRPLIRRLNLSFVSSTVTDSFLELFQGSVNLERTTLVNCSKLTTSAISKLLTNCAKLQSIDLTGVKNITDEIYYSLAQNCPRLQGLYAPGSQNISKSAVITLVTLCPMLKRIRFSGCANIDDEVIITLINSCPNIVELDLQGCIQVTDDSLKHLFVKLEQLREFKISQNRNITYECFSLLPNDPCLDKLRVVDFTSCELIGDKAIERLVTVAPRLRNVGLSKCTSITDASLRYLSVLGKCLHWIHLGHCSNITDFGATTLIRSCHRLQYVDFACCSQLTNETLEELAQLPRLRRIGLVKCVNINDASIEALANSRHLFEDTLERVHLSYCTQIGIYPVYRLLMACPKLTHLSLTGITAFLRYDITKFCRPPPLEFTDNQKLLFCVFSGRGVDALRNYLHSSITAQMARGGLIGAVTQGVVPVMRDDNDIGVRGQGWAFDPSIPAIVEQRRRQLPNDIDQNLRRNLGNLVSIALVNDFITNRADGRPPYLFIAENGFVTQQAQLNNNNNNSGTNDVTPNNEASDEEMEDL